MAKRVDLHLHTTASDGRLSAGELVQIAAEQGVGVIAITDHDTVASIEPALFAAECFPYVRVIPGVEINTDVRKGEVHVLGYFIDYKNEILLKSLSDLRNSRITRARKMVDKLKELGVPVAWERVLEIADGGSIGRPHIAQAMYELNHISTLQDAYDKYIGRNAPAYAERERVSPKEAVELIVQAGGIPVLAHPAKMADLEQTIVELKTAGLAGIETYYDGYGKEAISRLRKLAREHGLITTGGSDFHGFDDEHETPLGEAKVPFACAKRLISLARKLRKDHL
jgi:predicted metal-dependent phosphoesterase TrpH